MKHIYNIIPVAWVAVAILVFGCEDNRLNDIVDDQIYFLNSGLSHKQVFNLENATMDVVLIKSGIGKQSGAVTISVNESLVDAYNLENSTEFLPLPADLYSISNSRQDLGTDDYRVTFTISINGAGIQNIQEQTGLTYVIPLQAQVASGDLAASEPEKLESLIVPQVIHPYLSFTDTGLVSGRTIVNFDSPDIMELFSSVEVNFPNNQDIPFDIEIDPELVREYNERNGTSFKVLHDGAFSIDQSTLTLKEFENSHGFGFQIQKDGFIGGGEQYNFGNFLIPIRLISKGDIPADPTRQTQLLQVSFQPNQLDRSSWEIADWNSCICEEPQYEALERVPENILDGDSDTYWGSKWDEPKPFPYYIVVDMKSAHEVFQIELIKPTSDSWRGNMKSGYFEISDDGENWTRLGEWIMEENAPRSHLYSMVPQSGQYLKIVIEDAFNYFNAELGFDSGANVDLAEMVVWGR